MDQKVAVIMGSKSDLDILKDCIDQLKKLNIEFDVKIMSAHRTPDMVLDYVKSIETNNIKVIIAAAGKAAHLAGVIASHTIIPVIGVPVKSSTLDGLDSLLSTVQMPSGTPVATVAINGSQNAAILSAQILAINDLQLREKLEIMKKDMVKSIMQQNFDLEKELC